jgi:hypothetical protein
MAFFTLICMELSWMSLWFRLLMRPWQEISYWHAFLVFAGILLAVYYSDVLLSRQNVQLGARRLILAAVILVCVLIALVAFLNPEEWLNVNSLIRRSIESFRKEGGLIPAEFLVMAMALLMSGRGLSLVGRQLEPSTIQSGFRTGIIMLFLFGIIVQFREASPGTAFYLFLFSGMMAMSAARIALQSRLRGGRSIPFDRRWLVGLNLVCLFIAGLAYLVVSWLSGRGLDQLYTIYTWVISILIWLISPLLYLVAAVFQWLGGRLAYSLLLKNLMDLFQRLQAALTELMEFFQSWFANLGNLFRFNFPSLQIPRAWALWGTILFLLVLILLTLRRHVWNREAGEEEDVSDLDQADLFALLQKAIRKTLDQLLRQLEGVLGVRQASRLLAAARIRRIYARLLKLSARLGRSRPAAWTPLEFLPSLKNIFPDLPGELETITQAYMQVRYGELPETFEEVQKVEHAWSKISMSGETVMRLRKGVKVRN